MAISLTHDSITFVPERQSEQAQHSVPVWRTVTVGTVETAAEDWRLLDNLRQWSADAQLQIHRFWYRGWREHIAYQRLVTASVHHNLTGDARTEHLAFLRRLADIQAGLPWSQQEVRPWVWAYAPHRPTAAERASLAQRLRDTQNRKALREAGRSVDLRSDSGAEKAYRILAQLADRWASRIDDDAHDTVMAVFVQHLAGAQPVPIAYLISSYRYAARATWRTQQKASRRTVSWESLTDGSVGAIGDIGTALYAPDWEDRVDRAAAARERLRVVPKPILLLGARLAFGDGALSRTESKQLRDWRSRSTTAHVVETGARADGLLPAIPTEGVSTAPTHVLHSQPATICGNCGEPLPHTCY